ncbi:unnamed protein product, partial [Didymodactylos carnosus]
VTYSVATQTSNAQIVANYENVSNTTSNPPFQIIRNNRPKGRPKNVRKHTKFNKTKILHSTSTDDVLTQVKSVKNTKVKNTSTTIATKVQPLQKEQTQQILKRTSSEIKAHVTYELLDAALALVNETTTKHYSSYDTEISQGKQQQHDSSPQTLLAIKNKKFSFIPPTMLWLALTIRRLRLELLQEKFSWPIYGPLKRDIDLTLSPSSVKAIVGDGNCLFR